jgi:hypothetical protein
MSLGLNFLFNAIKPHKIGRMRVELQATANIRLGVILPTAGKINLGFSKEKQKYILQLKS